MTNKKYLVVVHNKGYCPYWVYRVDAAEVERFSVGLSPMPTDAGMGKWYLGHDNLPVVRDDDSRGDFTTVEEWVPGTDEFYAIPSTDEEYEDLPVFEFVKTYRGVSLD